MQRLHIQNHIVEIIKAIELTEIMYLFRTCFVFLPWLEIFILHTGDVQFAVPRTCRTFNIPTLFAERDFIFDEFFDLCLI